MGADFCHRLSSTHDSGLSVGHAQAFNSTGITPLAHPGASVPKTPFYARMYPKTDEVGSSFDFHPQESAYVIPPHVLSCSSYTPVPAMVSDNVYCSYGRHRGTGMYPARSPVEQWDTQVSWRYTFRLTRSLIPYFYNTGGPATDVTDAFPCSLYAAAMCRTLAAEG